MTPRRRHQLRNEHDGRPRRAAFTLVEMLVTVAIVSLMMVMFAQIFSLAAGSVTTQKGIARNDQRARVVLNMLRNDLDARTFENVVPFAANEIDPGVADPNRDFQHRRGFFYISENDPADGTDDVLQLVIDVGADAEVFGRATPLGTDAAQEYNEPEFDDSGSVANSSGSSQYAVVSYFLRHGVLYRHVLLLRKPREGTHMLAPANTPPGPPGDTRSFWDRFDYHAHHNGTDLVWHGVNNVEDWLKNDQGNALGDPRTRFGHHFGNGRPREFATNGAFIGRFTHEETSHVDFTWPLTNGRQPFAAGSAANDVDGDGVIDEYADGPRRGEDILMQHVHEFDIRVFDEGAGDFVNIGSSAAVDYQTSANTAYSSNDPDGHGRNIFDTWHPTIPTVGNGSPPFRPGGASPRPLRVIQIRLRFFDPDSEQFRQLTIRHALTDRSTGAAS